MQKPSDEKQALILAALAHPNRIRIVEELRGGVKCNCELMPILKLEQSNLSRHLKILVQAGILISWKDGLRVNFKVANKEIFRILDLAKSVAGENIRESQMVPEEV
jgi:DNA-binding transcriptional ArsR family regulator